VPWIEKKTKENKMIHL